jgi:hypothetical protein
MEDSEQFEIIDGLPPFREGPGPHLIYDIPWVEGMMKDLLSNKYPIIQDAIEAYTEHAKGASHYAIQKRLRKKLNAAICADAMVICLQYCYLMVLSGLGDALPAATDTNFPDASESQRAILRKLKSTIVW